MPHEQLRHNGTVQWRGREYDRLDLLNLGSGFTQNELKRNLIVMGVEKEIISLNDILGRYGITPPQFVEWKENFIKLYDKSNSATI